MRLIWTSDDEQKLLNFYYFLLTKGVQGHIEMESAYTEGSKRAGALWIVDEDDVRLAKQWLDEYLKDIHHPQFQGARLEGRAIEAASRSTLDKKAAASAPEVQVTNHKRSSIGPWTLALIITCSTLFILGLINALDTTGKVKVGSDLYEALMFDSPAPGQGEWPGVYELFLDYFKQKGTLSLSMPLFERVRQGEVWRLFTPSLLHGNLFHIFFNLIWLIVLGTQIERRVGGLRYLALVIFMGVFSNTCQYLMGGYRFLGFSGVICGMLSYIWLRQRAAPWEGYQLQEGTVAFIACFITVLAFAELVAFYLDLFHNMVISTGVANTAHLSGALAGVLCARLSFFSAQD